MSEFPTLNAPRTRVGRTLAYPAQIGQPLQVPAPAWGGRVTLGKIFRGCAQVPAPAWGGP